MLQLERYIKGNGRLNATWLKDLELYYLLGGHDARGRHCFDCADANREGV